MKSSRTNWTARRRWLPLAAGVLVILQVLLMYASAAVGATERGATQSKDLAEKKVNRVHPRRSLALEDDKNDTRRIRKGLP
ncbi:MAG TPA: hypothetical protein VLI90_01555 [Tepidisphaeraceae bacterium]|nr:hypothetical protein [Tepidisphaeraceae bacterium]